MNKQKNQCNSCLYFFSIYCVDYYMALSKNFATPKAAAAANTPIRVTFNAPFIGSCPVTLLLKYPKIKRQRMVNPEETINPS